MNRKLKINTQDGLRGFRFKEGHTYLFVGANGSGKTRLAAHIEEELGGIAHRVAAHRALSLNPEVVKVNEKQARSSLKTGNNYQLIEDSDEVVFERKTERWGSEAAVALLNDFDYLLQVLFAEQVNRTLISHRQALSGNIDEIIETKFEILAKYWEQILPHRQLHISGDNLHVSSQGDAEPYSASKMSDGERAVFYILGQVLVADKGSVLIFDEPELHIHRSIMSKLWDELESLRPDCAFVLITHDLDFASSRIATKYVVSGYTHGIIPTWNIRDIPQNVGFDEQLVTLILGSRKPILFVEGTETSLDLATYRCCYPDWTVIPRGSCEQVIHSVVTMRENKALTRIMCSGIVDRDANSYHDIEYLESLGVRVLPVSEIENIFLLPNVSKAILSNDDYLEEELETKYKLFVDSIFKSVNEKSKNEYVLRYCRRQIDRALKKVNLSASDSVSMLNDYLMSQVESLNIEELAESARDKIDTAISNNDLTMLLEVYDNKGLIAIAASHLKNCRKDNFEEWLIRVLSNPKESSIVAEIKNSLPRPIVE
ncbi:AAA family ATPase [Vibrio parahaemolyticus]|nr:AAA family ATPase [Vibrio parahaemolyticus]MDF4333682.1 AAA family ATPase [Vibrio parahaemolyticus]